MSRIKRRTDVFRTNVGHRWFVWRPLPGGEPVVGYRGNRPRVERSPRIGARKSRVSVRQIAPRKLDTVRVTRATVPPIRDTRGINLVDAIYNIYLATTVYAGGRDGWYSRCTYYSWTSTFEYYKYERYYEVCASARIRVRIKYSRACVVMVLVVVVVVVVVVVIAVVVASVGTVELR